MAQRCAVRHTMPLCRSMMTEKRTKTTMLMLVLMLAVRRTSASSNSTSAPVSTTEAQPDTCIPCICPSPGSASGSNDTVVEGTAAAVGVLGLLVVALIIIMVLDKKRKRTGSDTPSPPLEEGDSTVHSRGLDKRRKTDTHLNKLFDPASATSSVLFPTLPSGMAPFEYKNITVVGSQASMDSLHPSSAGLGPRAMSIGNKSTASIPQILASARMMATLDSLKQGSRATLASDTTVGDGGVEPVTLSTRDAYGFTALTYAMVRRDKGAIEKALKADASLVDQQDGSGNSLLHWSVRIGDMDILRLLLRFKARADARNIHNHTPLHVACLEGATADVVSLLLSSPTCDTAAVDCDGLTALSMAARVGHAHLVDPLLNAGSDINHCDFEDRTPLMLTCFMGYGAIARRLLSKRNAKVNHPDKRGLTALHWACLGSSEACVEALLKAKKVTIDRQNNRDETCLHLAAREGNANIVRLLLEGRPDLQVKELLKHRNHELQTALDYSYLQGHRDCYAAIFDRAHELGIVHLLEPLPPPPPKDSDPLVDSIAAMFKAQNSSMSLPGQVQDDDLEQQSATLHSRSESVHDFSGLAADTDETILPLHRHQLGADSTERHQPLHRRAADDAGEVLGFGDLVKDEGADALDDSQQSAGMSVSRSGSQSGNTAQWHAFERTESNASNTDYLMVQTSEESEAKYGNPSIVTTTSDSSHSSSGSSSARTSVSTHATCSETQTRSDTPGSIARDVGTDMARQPQLRHTYDHTRRGGGGHSGDATKRHSSEAVGDYFSAYGSSLERKPHRQNHQQQQQHQNISSAKDAMNQLRSRELGTFVDQQLNLARSSMHMDTMHAALSVQASQGCGLSTAYTHVQQASDASTPSTVSDESTHH